MQGFKRSPSFHSGNDTIGLFNSEPQAHEITNHISLLILIDF